MLCTFVHHAGKKIVKNWNILNVLQHVPIHIKIDFQKVSNLLIRKMMSSIFFFPKFCERDLHKKYVKIDDKKLHQDDISNSVCKHSRSCQICRAVSNISLDNLERMVAIHEQVKESKKYNFEYCRIPVNDKLNFNFMRTMLRDYSDIQVCDLLEFGFPIGFKGDENSFPRFSSLSKIRNHKGAVEFTKEINNYLEKESFEKTIFRPF